MEPQQQATFFRELTKRVSELPGVESAGATMSLPLGGSNSSFGRSFVREGRAARRRGSLQTEHFAVTPDYFQTMRIPVRAGRSFTDHDTAETPPSSSSTRLSRVASFRQDPIGKRITVWPDEKFAREIVGVVGDVKAATLDEETGHQIYVPHAQDAGWGTLSLAVRTKGEPEALTAAVRGAIASIDKDQPAYRHQDDGPSILRIRRQNTSHRAALWCLLHVCFIARNNRNLRGDRLLGRATHTRDRYPSRARRANRGCAAYDHHARHDTRSHRSGLGLVGAFSGTRVMRSLLYGVSTTDPLIFIGVSLLLTVVALRLATFRPDAQQKLIR